MMRVKNIHFIGIGGSGMSGIASILSDLGYKVSGSDINSSKTTDLLKKKNIKISIGHKKDNILSKDVVIISSAVKNDNVEYKYAKQLNIPIIKRAEMLAELMRFSYGIAVAGTHGKTSTTSILSHILNEASYDPTYIIGGKIINSSNARLGSSDYLVAEADESDASFLHLQPLMSVITNIDKDHLENHENSFDVLKKNFLEFINNLPFYGLCLINMNDINTRSIINKISRPVKTFGINTNADYVANEINLNVMPATYLYKEDGKEYEIKINMPGQHNIMNSLAALAVSRELNVPIKIIQKALINFPGIKRRFEIIGNFNLNKNFFLWIDDYGHHPTEIEEVLKTIKNVWENRRVIMIFQPHRYSRTAEHFNQFVDILKKVDNLILMEIYAANEKPIDNISSEAISLEIKKYNNNVLLINNNEDLAKSLDDIIEENDILLTMGAGNISQFVNYYKEIIQ
ncbi:MAG: UDP-N-acetylmuramate--L-alanine ligase [Gammaproteobacteria bacterium]|nr:UDP-N-acetylmuramate--L-alanine ligase [Gammaproteobacteria bacterium]MBT7523102.1 UDP-N-acetylmuramate--L-alanine ligase [Gammaproteobacteria bacterium]MBT7814825.1 UDP-N-acetylmuramate--L-alanine ligase [Gammaproteobacteria bacterium]